MRSTQYVGRRRESPRERKRDTERGGHANLGKRRATFYSSTMNHEPRWWYIKGQLFVGEARKKQTKGSGVDDWLAGWGRSRLFVSFSSPNVLNFLTQEAGRQSVRPNCTDGNVIAV